jgi:hypothetical protein
VTRQPAGDRFTVKPGAWQRAVGGNGTGLELVVGIKDGALRVHGVQWTAGGFLPDRLVA